MKRIIISIGVIIAAFSIAFTGFFLVDKKCKELELNLAEICNISQQNNTEKAIALSDETVELWEDVHDTIESFIRQLRECSPNLAQIPFGHQRTKLQFQFSFGAQIYHRDTLVVGGLR